MIGLDDIIEHKKHKLEKAQGTLPLDEIERAASPVKKGTCGPRALKVSANPLII